jgi:allantoicase
VDTAHFKGNFAFKVAVYGALLGDLPDLALPALSIYWAPLIAPTELTADAIHEFTTELQDIGPVDHLRIDMIPDGGISRLRAWGKPEIQDLGSKR